MPSTPSTRRQLDARAGSVYGKWPLSGEIDLMENVGWEPGVVRASIHTARNHRRRGNHNRRVSGVKDAHTAFHVYACDWTPDLPYSSARLTTRDAPHGRWRYGRVEVCAKLPPGKPGLWPAIWMMPSRSVQCVNHALHAITMAWHWLVRAQVPSTASGRSRARST